MTPKIPISVMVVIHTPVLEILLIGRAARPGYWQSVTGSIDRADEPLESIREARWFPSARLNFAENHMRRRDDGIAIIAYTEAQEGRAL